MNVVIVRHVTSKCQIVQYCLILGVVVVVVGVVVVVFFFFFFSSRRRHTRLQGDWSSDVCSSDLYFSNLEVIDNCYHSFAIVKRICLKITEVLF